MIVAWTALILWPVVGIILYRSLPFRAALPAIIIGGYLLLPTRVGLDIPILPPLDKHTVPALVALALGLHAALQSHVASQAGWLPKNKMARVFLVVLLISAVGTALTNTDPVLLQNRQLPGLRTYDVFSIGLDIAMMLIPFFLARKFLATQEAQTTFVLVLVLAACGYAFLALWEIRMSPQLNNQIYGFFPHSWLQHMRGGGFRPLVFLKHGLWLAIFFASAIVAALSMARAHTSWQPVFMIAGVWLIITLALSRSLGALLIVCVLSVVALALPRRLQILSVASVAVVVLSYPILRAVDVIPTTALTDTAAQISVERAGSLDFRFDNEDILLERAAEKPIFGWGGWGRNRVFDERGRDISTTDGRWVILFGQGGWMRYLGEFGLLTLGGLALFFRRREALYPASIALALALSANLLDLLVNAGLSPLTWLMAGSLVGGLEERVKTPEDELSTTPLDKTLRYRRSFGDPPRRPVRPRPSETSPSDYARGRTAGLRRDHF